MFQCPAPPPSHILTAQYSFLKLMPWLQVLSTTKYVILGSQSTIKSIIVPSTNMGYLCSLKTLNFCTFSDIHQSHGLIQNFSFYTLTVCKHVFIADSLIQNFHTLTHKRFASMSSLQIALFKSSTHSHIKVCKHVFIAQSGIWISVCERVVCVSINFYFPFS